MLLTIQLAAAADRCAWGPVEDVQAVPVLLSQWAASANLPAFDKDKWDLSIDRSNALVTLRFAQGSLILAWTLDEKCEAAAITVQASPDYNGSLPDDAAVKRLVASLRTKTVEQRSGSPAFAAPPQNLLGVGLGLVLAYVLLRTRRRWNALGMKLGALVVLTFARLRRLSTISQIQLLGLIGIVALLPYQSPPSAPSCIGGWLSANALLLMAVLPLIAFLWLVVSGFFGYGSARREDWPALLLFLLALGIREAYARHGVEGDVLHFMGRNGFDSHSIVYTFFLMFIHPFAHDPFKMQMHTNGILGAVAALPLYLFVRQRTGSRTAAMLVVTFYAVHPILAQMAPTDSPYSLCFATWFMGLTLLSKAEVGARELVGGATLLGIAAICRPEGSLFLAASVLLIDGRALLRAVRLHLGAATLALGVLVGMLAAEVDSIFSMHMGSSHALPVDAFTIAATLKAGLWSTDYNDLLIVILVIVGAVAGLVNTRLRLGFGAALGALIVVWPFCGTTYGGYIILHRLSATCALQVIAAGVGACWITSWLPTRLRQHWTSALPGVLAALYLLVAHHHEIHDPIGLSDEFWMLRNHLAPGGVVKKDCRLVWVGRSMDTDIHNFQDVVPEMEGIRCQERDCLADIAKGGCFYYMRGLNCFYSEAPTKPECLQRGKTPTGGYLDCIDPECVRVETSLQLELIEQRTVDVHSVWNYEHGQPPDPHFPVEADVGLYRVVKVKH